MNFSTSAEYWMPLVFMGLMGLSLLIYVVLDGYDLGVGLLMAGASDAEKDQMVASIGPFWDANETWLVLGVGILLVAFPKAHGLILQALYLPVALMLLGLMLRGVAFDFRVKAQTRWKPLWNRAFMLGSLLAATSQGWMLARYITGFAEGWAYTAFAAVIALALASAYALLGAGWLLMKTEGDLQRLAVRRAKLAWPAVVLGLALVSLATPLVSPTVFRALVPHARADRPVADSLDDGTGPLGPAGAAELAPGAGQAVLAALRLDGAGDADGLSGPGLQPLPLCDDRSHDRLAGGRRAEVPGHHPLGLCRHRAGHPDLHRVRLQGVLGQIG